MGIVVLQAAEDSKKLRAVVIPLEEVYGCYGGGSEREGKGEGGRESE